jgi:FkbM family methyltransferase
MKKIFLDCGTNLGQGLLNLQNVLDENFEIYCFEANKLTYDRFIEKLKDNNFLKTQFKNIQTFNKAIWTSNGFKRLTLEYCPHEVGWVGGATNILEDNFVKPSYINEQYIKNGDLVETIDLVEFIQNNFSQDDYIICKMDIEGAEYPVLEKMIEKDILKYIKVFYIEWHNRMLKNKYDESKIINHILNSQIELREWH